MTDFGWDYPPGMKESDIPGCSREDQVYEDIIDEVDGMDDVDICEALSKESPKAFERWMKNIREALCDARYEAYSSREPLDYEREDDE